MPRLLILCEFPTLLGGERSMLATLPAVAASGFEIHVAGPPTGPLADALRECGISQLAWTTNDDRGERLPLDRLRSELAQVIRNVRPDLLHANSLSTARIAGPVAIDCGLRSLGHLRDIVKLAQRPLDDLNAHRRLVAVSRATRDFHVEQGIDPRRCVVVFNGVDLDEFRPRPPTGYLHREFGLPPTARLIATIGQLGLRKGTDVALASALQVAPDVPDAHWLVVGERTSNKEESCEFEELLHSISEEPPLVGRVHFLGSRPDVPRLLNECVLLVHAARQEPLGRVLLEAAASGLAVVATDVGGTHEIFPAGADGAILVPPDSRLAMADAMLALLQNEERRQSLGAGGRRRAEEAFDVRQAAARLIEHYEAVLI
jgi:glycosyltransferase involved in cell wall biosynthesis